MNSQGNSTRHSDKALSLFACNFHCSQAVIAAFADECGISEEQALKLGGCLGSGMRKGEVCGACTGALVVLGLLYGQTKAIDLESRRIANKVNDLMMDRFAQANGSYLCKDLLQCDISTPDGVQYARDNNLFTDFCPRMVQSAVDIIESIISENDYKRSEL